LCASGLLPVARQRPRPGAIPVQVKRQARGSKVLRCRLKQRTDLLRGVLPSESDRDDGSDFAAKVSLPSWNMSMGVGGSLPAPLPPLRVRPGKENLQR